jgi:hypothetical protein
MSDYLCRNVKLTIELKEEGRQIRFTLRDDLSLREVELWTELGDNTLDRRYHIREAIIIAMRRVIAKAIESHLILDYPGESTNSKSGNTAPPNPSITFSTGGV